MVLPPRWTILALVIEVERVHLSFETPVLRGAALRVERGEIVGLVGPPASGKSVLLRVIAGLLEPQVGSVRIEGAETVGISSEELARVQARIGMAFQNVALFEHLSVGENLAFPHRRVPLQDQARLTPRELQQRIAEELAYVGLSGFEDRAISGLSGGQKRRVGIARAAITRPPILLYDEPAAGLDPVSSSRMFALLAEQRERLGSTLLVVSSDLDRLFAITDRVAVLHRGRVLCQGALREVLDSPLAPVREFLAGIEAPLFSGAAS